MEKVRVCSLFSGIGGFETGIFNSLGQDRVEIVFASEIDKHASVAYKNIYGHMPHGDITKVDAVDIPDHDILVGGFPCQAFSVSGKRLGFDDTRGTLFFDIVRIAKEKKPKVMVLENVKGLVSHDKGRTLQVIARTLSEIGYKIDLTILNSKNFGVPQNRERIFIVCHRDVMEESWKIPKGNGAILKAKRSLMELGSVKMFNFEFPRQEKVSVCLKDILEQDIDPKYFLKTEKIDNFVSSRKYKEISEAYIKESEKSQRLREFENLMLGIEELYQGSGELQQLGYIDKNAQGNRVYSAEGVSPTVSSQTGGLGGSGGGVVAVMLETLKEDLEQDIKDIVSRSRPKEKISVKFKDNGDIRPHRNDPRKSGISELNISYDENQSYTVTASHAPKVYGFSTQWRIRKLSPLECFRLQGFPDTYYDLLKEEGISDRQLYKMAGNAVTTDVIEAIFDKISPYLSEER
jgi:DNA (cytosine-5)-methyltransferase 1